MKTWETMSPRERDALVAERVLNIQDIRLVHGEWWGGCIVFLPSHSSGYELPIETHAILPAYTTDPNAARMVEDEIERRGLQQSYVAALEIRGSTMTMPTIYGWDGVWAAIRATPEQRCLAALQAVGEGV